MFKFILILIGLISGLAYFWYFGMRMEEAADPRYGTITRRRIFKPKGIIIASLIFMFFLILPVPLTVVPAGHVSVLTLFGKVYGQVPEGLHIVNPLAATHTMSVRTQEMFEHSVSPSVEGLNVIMETSLLYRLNAIAAKNVYQSVGLEYGKVVVQPTFRSAIRGATVKHDAKALYTSGRELISSEISASLTKELKERGIIIEGILLRKIQLPSQVQQAIDAKLSADQEAQRMVFILQKETQEAERKRIEAKGIHDFQHIVSQGISEQLLKWKGIEATEKIAQSHNAKIVIVGGKDGLPLILNSGK